MIDLKNTDKVVGTRQTKKAIENGQAKHVYLAQDADSRVIDPIQQLCKEKGIDYEYIASKEELGRATGIDVATAVVAIL